MRLAPSVWQGPLPPARPSGQGLGIATLALHRTHAPGLAGPRQRTPHTGPRRPSRRTRQAGESLLSLLVGLGLGLLVIAAGIRLLGLQWQTQRQQLQQVALQQDLQTALGFLAQELQQAQHLAQAWQSRADGPCSDPLCSGEGALRLAAGQIEWASDRNRNGQRENAECTGFRLRNGVLQHKTACEPAVWSALTDPASLQLTRLDLRLHCRLEGQRLVRRVDLLLDGHSPHNPALRQQVQQQLALRNDLPLSLSSSAPDGDCPTA
jgi:type II secretory pathway component PulJ